MFNQRVFLQGDPRRSNPEKFPWIAASGLTLLAMTMALISVPAQAAHGIALWGDLKYPASFTHFDYVNPNAPKGGSLKLSTNAAFDSINPYILKGVGAPGINGYVYQTLMTASYDEPQSYYPLIASAVTLAADRSYADFTLNPNAKWSDGTALTSKDVVWSFNTLKAHGHPSLKVQYKAITIAARGAHAVRFTFADKTHRELPLIAANLPVLPQHYFCAQEEESRVENRESSKEDVTTRAVVPPPIGGGSSPAAIPVPSTNHQAPGTTTCIPFEKTTLAIPIGSGPYVVSKIDAGRSITFMRNKTYWGANLPSQRGLNNFDTIQVDVYRDDTVALEGIKSHQFDFYEEYIARNWATAYDTPAITSGELIKTLIPNKIPRGMQGFIFNTREAKFADRRVREAIGLTLDFEWMNRVLFYGAYERGKSFFGNTEFEAKGLPSADELKLLAPYRGDGPVPPPVRGRLEPVLNLIQEGGRDEASTVPISAPPHPSPYGGGSAAPAAAPTSTLPPSTFPSQGGKASATSSPATGDANAAPPLPLRERVGVRGGEAATSRHPPPTSTLPPSIFTHEYTVPTTDGSGIARANLIRAQQLLNEAGWVMKDGRRVNAKTGAPLTIEFMMTQRTFERVIAIMRHNLNKLGIASTFRYVDASQYQKRLERKQFDMVSVWWNLGLFYPSTEQYLYWHSSQANIEGSQNLSGANHPAVDALVEKIQAAQSLDALRPAARALDRVLMQEHYIIPHWNLSAWRVAYWNQFGRPEITPAYNLGIDAWWDKGVSGRQSPVTSEGEDTRAVLPLPLRERVGVRGREEEARVESRESSEGEDTRAVLPLPLRERVGVRGREEEARVESRESSEGEDTRAVPPLPLREKASSAAPSFPYTTAAHHQSTQHPSLVAGDWRLETTP